MRHLRRMATVLSEVLVQIALRLDNGTDTNRAGGNTDGFFKRPLSTLILPSFNRQQRFAQEAGLRMLIAHSSR